MNSSTGYKTKQRSLILNYLSKNKDKHITADDVLEHFRKRGEVIGKSTVYRYLNVLLEKGIIRKHFIGTSNVSCYQYVTEATQKNEMYHLKCMNCQKVMDITCHELDQAQAAVLNHYQFKIDFTKTIFYGYCESCNDSMSDEQ